MILSEKTLPDASPYQAGQPVVSALGRVVPQQNFTTIRRYAIHPTASRDASGSSCNSEKVMPATGSFPTSTIARSFSLSIRTNPGTVSCYLLESGS